MVKNSVGKISVIGWLLTFTMITYAQDSVVYKSVDKYPVYKGDVQKALHKELRYPYVDFMQQNEGVVTVSVVITSEGEVSDIQVVEGINETLDAEAARAVGKLNKWKAGVLDKQKVNTQITIPVNFTIGSEQMKMLSQLRPLYEDGKNPLFVLDNKEVKGIVNIEYYNVKSIRVLKGEKALKLYGEKAKDGVIVIETKRGTRPDYQMY